MASAGHKFIAHTKSLSPRAQSNGSGFGLPPHPLEVRPGQRFWPRSGQRKVEFVVRSLKGGQAVVRQDGSTATATASLARLLAARDDDDQGRWYQFQGFVPRRYATLAMVYALDDRAVTLCVPEWHPRRPVHLFRSLLPAGAAAPGAWLALTCDLSAPSAARLQPARLLAVDAPPAGTFHPPRLD